MLLCPVESLCLLCPQNAALIGDERRGRAVARLHLVYRFWGSPGAGLAARGDAAAPGRLAQPFLRLEPVDGRRGGTDRPPRHRRRRGTYGGLRALHGGSRLGAGEVVPVQRAGLPPYDHGQRLAATAGSGTLLPTLLAVRQPADRTPAEPKKLRREATVRIPPRERASIRDDRVHGPIRALNQAT